MITPGVVVGGLGLLAFGSTWQRDLPGVALAASIFALSVLAGLAIIRGRSLGLVFAVIIGSAEFAGSFIALSFAGSIWCSSACNKGIGAVAGVLLLLGVLTVALALREFIDDTG